MLTYEVTVNGTDIAVTMTQSAFPVTLSAYDFPLTMSQVGQQGAAGPKGDPGSVDSVDVAGGTGIDSSGGPITTTGTVTVALDAASQASLALADSAQQPPSEGPFINGDKTKLDGIEAGATGDQTGAEIKTAYESQANTNAFTDTEQSKLAGITAGAEPNTVDSVNTKTGIVVINPDDLNDTATTNKFTTAGEISKLAGIEAGADVTDAANVTAAGALMDSEVVNLADVKSFDPADYATAAQGGLAVSAVQPGDNVSDLTNDVGYINTVTEADVTQHEAALNITESQVTDLDRIRWKLVWVQQEYVTNDMVRDGDWLMIANTTTTDRAAPQPVGAPAYDMPDSPAWGDQSYVGVVKSGREYDVTAPLELTAYQIWVPNLTSDYKVTTYTYPTGDPDQIVFEVVPLPDLNVDGWTTVQLTRSLITSGTTFGIILEALNSSGNVVVSGDWTRGANSIGAPANQQWNTNNAETVLRMDWTDNTATDRQVDLTSIVPGSVVTFVSTTNTTQSASWRINADGVDMGAYIEWQDVTYLGAGSGGEPSTGGLTTMTADVPTPASTDYVRILDGNPGANSRGLLELDGVPQANAENHAYGVRVLYDLYTVSPDWDFVGYIGLGEGGTSGGGSANDLGSAAYEDVGTEIGNVVQVDGDGGLPAIDGSKLTGIDAGPTPNDATITISAGTGLTTGGNFTTDQGSNETITINTDVATAANIWAGTANKVITADGVESACEPVTISGASNWTPNWSTFAVADWVITANRTINNPSAVEVGTTRYAFISGSSTTDRIISWGSYYEGNLPDVTVDSNTAGILVSMTAKSTTLIVVSFVEYVP